MNTDTPFYRIFQERPPTVFELAGLPVPERPDYRLHAEEVKQTAFRLDGVLLPAPGRADLPLVFIETQFYPKPDFYARWLASIFLYLFRHPGIARSWRAIAVFPDRTIDLGDPVPYEPLLQCGLVHRVYLAELPDDPQASFGTRLARLAVLDAAPAVTEARDLLATQAPGHSRDLAVDLVETVLVYKFPNLSRDEIRIMLNLPQTDLKKTRFYQEVFGEGRQEGRQEGRMEGRMEGREVGERDLILRLLERRLGPLDAARRSRIETLRGQALDALGEALLDFATPADLDLWLSAHAA